MTTAATPFPSLAHGLATLDAFPIAGALAISPDRPGVDFDALERARAVLVQAWRNDLSPEEIAVTAQGGLTISWRRAGWALEVTIDPFALSAFRLDSPSKMVEWTRAGSDATVADAKAALAEERDAPSRLKRFIQLHFSVVEKNPDLASVLVVELRQSAQLLKAADRQKLGAAYLELIGQVVREGQERGELTSSVSPGTAKRTIFGALDELALGWLLSGRRASLKKTGHEVAEWLVRGLLPEQPGGKA
jgi:hypothetical protein